jgi:hypothetical protein
MLVPFFEHHDGNASCFGAGQWLQDAASGAGGAAPGGSARRHGNELMERSRCIDFNNVTDSVTVFPDRLSEISLTPKKNDVCAGNTVPSPCLRQDVLAHGEI